MPVKHIVGVFEERARSTGASAGGSSSSARAEGEGAAAPRGVDGPRVRAATKEPAKGKVIAHPLLRTDDDTPAVITIDGLPDTILTSLIASGRSSIAASPGCAPIAGGPPQPERKSTLRPARPRSSSRSHKPRREASHVRAGEHAHEMHVLSSGSAHTRFGDGDDGGPALLPSDTDSSGRDTDHEDSAFASSATLVQGRRGHRAAQRPPKPVHAAEHAPVAAATVFSRSAAPLALLDLDQHIASLPAPSFPSFPGTPAAAALFPPLDRLEATGKTIDDLEHNAQVPHWWQSRKKYFGAFVTLSLSITGSSMLVSLYSLHGLIDTVQIFALLLNTIDHKSADTSAQWRKFLLGTMPNVLALNLATSIRIALIMLITFMSLAGVLLYLFRRATAPCCTPGSGTPEGLQPPPYLATARGARSQWALLLISFLLTAIYLPLSTMAVHVLVWSDDLWVVPNPYQYPNGTALAGTPVLAPLGPPEKFRDPLDFCWTTTMERNEVNYAGAVVVVALVCFCALTIWFPLHLRRVIQAVSPKVDRYTELGARRSGMDMDLEYQRLLDRDTNPLNFLYHDYRRGWATYEATYLMAKLAALLIVAAIDPSNCLFRNLPRVHVQVARQITLLVAMIGFFALQCYSAPFLDPVGNASEWTSRVNYVLTALIALLVALDVPGQSALNGWVLYIVYGVTYGLSLYFTVVDWSIVQRLVKRLARRIDFSIDIFSPRVDITPGSHHTKRRIWQESITALFLTDPTCAIPASQRMLFAQARDVAAYPPYLFQFAGTPGERHVENLKILREVGQVAYDQGVALIAGPDVARFADLRERIQLDFVGPDCYWRDPARPAPPGCKRFFGNAWFVPFPPTVVLRYDDGPLAVLDTIADLELYVRQNESRDIQRRREVRMALRALDGQVVLWPYDFTQAVGGRRPLCCCLPGRRFRAENVFHYRAGIFRLLHNHDLPYEGLNLGSGFSVAITYARSVVVDGGAIGLTDDYDLTPPLARFLTLNEELVPAPLALIEDVLARYRHAQRAEAAAKAEALSYRFLAFVYNRPREPTGLAQSSIAYERDARVRKLMLGSEDVFRIAWERLRAVSASPLATWWYIFWDDLWRRNHDTIGGLQQHASDFNPHYPTSIAYRPLPRAALEAFLAQRGLLHKKPKWGDFFHAGFLNKIYLRMNDIVYHGTARADIIHLGANGPEELDMEDVDAQTQARPSTLGTGNGTDEDDVSIRARPLYRWEGILEDPLRAKPRHHERFLAKLGVWFGVTPRWRSGIPSMGLALDVRLDHGQYVLSQDQGSSPTQASDEE